MLSLSNQGLVLGMTGLQCSASSQCFHAQQRSWSYAMQGPATQPIHLKGAVWHFSAKQVQKKTDLNTFVLGIRDPRRQILGK